MARRVLMITSSSSGGGPKQLSTLTEHLSSDFVINVACPNNSIYLNDIEASISGKLLFIKERKISFLDIYNIIKFIKQNSIELVHSHGKAAGFLARMAFFFTRIKLIHTYHGVHLSRYKVILKILYVTYERIFSMINTYNIFVSISEMKMAKDSNILLKDKSVVIPNGVLDQELKETKTNYINRLRQSLSIPTNITVAITSCRLEQIKNLFELIDIAQANSDIFFYVMGEGPLRSELNRYIRLQKLSNIILLGHITNVFDYLNASDIYISTSLREGHPLSVLEAMSVGLPVLATAVPGNLDTIIHGDSGFFYELGNIEQASYFLNKLSSNNKLRKQIGANAQCIQKLKFSVSAMTKAYGDLYKSVQ